MKSRKHFKSFFFSMRTPKFYNIISSIEIMVKFLGACLFWKFAPGYCQFNILIWLFYCSSVKNFSVQETVHISLHVRTEFHEIPVFFIEVTLVHDIAINIHLFSFYSSVGLNSRGVFVVCFVTMLLRHIRHSPFYFLPNRDSGRLNLEKDNIAIIQSPR